MNKTPTSNQPVAPGAPGADAHPGGTPGGASGLSLQSAMGLWKAYAPAVLDGLLHSGAAPGAQAASSSQATASSTSLQANTASNAERRSLNSSFVSFVGTPEAAARASPSFREANIGQ